MTGRIPATVQVLTHNSAASIDACLRSLTMFDEVMVQDGCSADGTADRAKKYPNVVVRMQPAHAIGQNGRVIDFSAVRNDGIKSAKHDWILVIDADEEIGDDLVSEVRLIVNANIPGVYRAFRRFVVHGKKMLRSAFYPAYQIRLFHRSCVTGYVKPVHERLNVLTGLPEHTLATEVLVPQPPARELIHKYERYLQMEVARTLGMSYARWLRWILLRNIISMTALTIRSIALRIRHCFRDCLPFSYEWLHVRHLLRTIVFTFPPIARRYAKNDRTAAQTSSI